MSHFTTLVITRGKRPTLEELDAQLQPWHEYECTGEDDQYVIDVDYTDKVNEAVEEQRGDPKSFFADCGGDVIKFGTDYFGADHKDGKFFRRTNPNARWDWWAIGGRWAGMFESRLDSGTPGATRCDQIEYCDLDSGR